MPGADQHHQLDSSSSHQERTYILSRQECQEQINTIRFIPASATMRELTSLLSQEYQEQINTISLIPAPATMRELTNCQGKNARSRSTPSTSFQLLQPP
jgi:hypothetical protein